MILAFPALAVVILLGFVGIGEVSAYRMSTDTVRAVSLSLAVQDLIQQLQTERGVTAGLLGGNVSFREELAVVRKQVDAQRAAIDRLTSGGGAVEKKVRAVLRDLDGMTAIRVGTDAATIQRAPAFQFFTASIAALGGVDYGLEHSTDRDLARGMAVLQALGDLKESTAQERAFLNGVFSAGGFGKGEFLQFSAMRAAKQTALDRFNRQATPRQREANAYVLDTGAARTAAHFEQTALGAFDGRHVIVNPQSWWSALTTVLDDMQRMQVYVGSEIQARAETLQNRAALRLAELIGVVLFCFVGAVALLVTASRSITQPLATLAAEADGVARVRLPEAVARVQATDDEETFKPPDPVRVPGRASSEIRSVANALDRVQAAAFELALEQATLRRRTTDSLANLGRRSQNLLRRQLGFITRLEREESDPSGLANLFELDHLATRMRRNAESLLVLVGAATPRQWATPLPVADVIRAAVSEVEEYRRVALRRIDDGYIAGTVVSGITHILAELIENGLTFSPPDSEVEIQGRMLGGTYLIAITDQGVGMSPDELATATARLRGESDFVLAPSRYIGHHVVGHLARSMKVDVQLSPSPVTGVTARVTLPESMLTLPEAIRARPEQAITQCTVELPVTTAKAPEQVWAPAPSRPDPVGAEARPYQTIDTIDYIVTPSPPVGAHVLVAPDGYGPAQASAAGVPPVPSVQPVPRGPNGTVPVDGGPAGATPVPGGAGYSQSGGAGHSQSGGAGHSQSAGPPADGEHTRNGLRKRPPRTRAARSRPVPPEQRPDVAEVDHSPNEVRARLSSLRAGVRRGEAERQTVALQRHAPEDTPDPGRTGC